MMVYQEPGLNGAWLFYSSGLELKNEGFKKIFLDPQVPENASD